MARLAPLTVRRAAIGSALVHGALLAVACFVSYTLITEVLSEVHSVSDDDDKLGGMWAVVATVFVFRVGSSESIGAAASRTVATLVSFALCFAYLLVLPSNPVGLAVLIGLGTVILMAVGRDGDVVTAGITTAVVMVVAAIAPGDAWQQPILRLVDTATGIVIGLVAVGVADRLPQRSHDGSRRSLR